MERAAHLRDPRIAGFNCRKIDNQIRALPNANDAHARLAARRTARALKGAAGSLVALRLEAAARSLEVAEESDTVFAALPKQLAMVACDTAADAGRIARG